MSIVVIGLGSVGRWILEEICNKTENKEEVIGVDTDKEKVNRLAEFNTQDKLDKAYDVYIICVYTTEQVFDVLKTLDYSRKPLVSVESTIIPGTEVGMAEFVLEKGGHFVLCPQRYSAGDPKHQIFNTNRLIAGANEESLRMGIGFYSRFMDKELLIQTDLKHAALSKVLENSYRFLEISAAEELKMLCDSKGYDFNELRRCANTKWNIDIMEARDGIDGECLPKDTGMFNELFPDNVIFKGATNADRAYKKKVENERAKSAKS